MSEKKWEELKTPASVLAAFEAGRRVEWTACTGDTIDMPPSSGGWITPGVLGHTTGRYRALIEEPAIPAGYKPWGGGKCPDDARNGATVIQRTGRTVYLSAQTVTDDVHWSHWGTDFDIIAYRVEQAQPSQQGEAEFVGLPGVLKEASEILSRIGESGVALPSNWRWPLADELSGFAAMLSASPRPIPAESPGRDAEGLADRDAGGKVVREAWVRWALTQPNPKPSWLVPYDELSEPDKEADRQIFEAVARRLRPQVSDDVTGSLERIRLAADNGGLNEGQCYSIWRTLTVALTEADSHG